MLDIKLKNFSRKWYFKLAAYMVIMVCTALASFQTWSVLREIDFDTYNLNFLDQKEYIHSQLLRENTDQFANIAYNLENESNDTEKQVDEWIQIFYQQWTGQNYSSYPVIIQDEDISLNYTWHNLNDEGEDTADVTSGETRTMENFLKKNPTLKEEVKIAVLAAEEAQQREYEWQLSDYEEYTRITIKNAGELSRWEDSNIVLEAILGEQEYTLCVGVHETDISNEIVNYLNKNENSSCLVVGMSKDVFSQRSESWTQSAEIFQRFIIHAAVLMGIIIVMVLYLIAVTGRRPKEEAVHLYKGDKIFSEVQLPALLCSAIAIGGCVYYVVWKIYGSFFERIDGVLPTIGVCLLVVFMIVILLSQVRRLKAKKFWDGFILFRILKKIVKVAAASWKRGKISRRALVLAVVLPILCATWVGAPFVILFLIFLIYKYLNDFTAVCEGTQEIRNGNLQHKIKVTAEDGELYRLSEDINQISQGLECAVSGELKSERLKSELISNVSHDLKTPLTSIITYVDLLKKEEISNEKVKEYIAVIDRKAERLSVLTSDLFEAAKASSGDMPVNMEKIDFRAVVRQALGEYEEKIVEAGLELKMNLPEQPVWIQADGKLTWRAIANLLSNVVKYAQSKSRVYIEISQEPEQGYFSFTIKNISAGELNIPVDELMERFKRADSSRSTEGSGLGLSIANSLITLQNGKLELMVDGDLFKAVIRLQAA
ncbi:MAG: HAMP domain-containing sensor histidine kinase [Lachnospiraceae bacterium]